MATKKELGERKWNVLTLGVQLKKDAVDDTFEDL